MKIIKGFDSIYQALLEGKKITLHNRSINYVYPNNATITVANENKRMSKEATFNKRFPHINIDEIDFIPNDFYISSYSSSTYSKVLYFRANPQMNRTFAMLENGDEVDYDLDILTLKCCEFVEYELDAKEMTVEEIENKLGHRIKIKS